MFDELGDFDTAVAKINEEKGLESPKIIEYRRAEIASVSSLFAKITSLTSVKEQLGMNRTGVYLMPEFMVTSNQE